MFTVPLLFRSVVLIAACLVAAGGAAADLDSGELDSGELDSGELDSGELRNGEPRHGLSYFGDLKYPDSFEHFDYVNPDAPKGGAIHMAEVGNFDSLNPFIRKGRKAAGFNYYDILLTYDRLMMRAHDEPSAMYGLLAESAILADDFTWVQFRLRPEARWHDGEPVTARDVLWTYEQIKAHGSPALLLQFDEVIRAEVIGEYEIIFHMPEATSPRSALSIADLPVAPAHYWIERGGFDQTSLVPPLGSGPYRLVSVKPGKQVVFERVDDYWARDLPVNKGRFNFDRVGWDYFNDINVVIESVKAGEIDAHLELMAKRWFTQYDFPGYNDGHFVKKVFANHQPVGMQVATAFNLRLPKFRDVRVREALWLVYDFDWRNRVLMYDFYNRTYSWFSNSDLAATGFPSEAELDLLTPYRGRIPERVFTHSLEVTTNDGHGYPRDELIRARDLLREAGYHIDSKGNLVDGDGDLFTVDLISNSPGSERLLVPYAEHLHRLGISTSIRTMETSQFISRMGRFEFEMAVRTWSQLPIPGPELRNYFSSEAASQQFSRNEIGISDPVVDELVEQVLSATSYEELKVAARALDRVMLWNFYAIPGYWGPGYRYGYWNKYDFPETRPRYRTGYFDTWWYDERRAQRVERYLRGARQ